MTKPLLLTVCAVLVVFGIFTIAVSTGFFVQLLGATVMALGDSAAYLISATCLIRILLARACLRESMRLAMLGQWPLNSKPGRRLPRPPRF